LGHHGAAIIIFAKDICVRMADAQALAPLPFMRLDTANLLDHYQ
jgi:hypothetical protein